MMDNQKEIKTTTNDNLNSQSEYKIYYDEIKPMLEYLYKIHYDGDIKNIIDLIPKKSLNAIYSELEKVDSRDFDAFIKNNFLSSTEYLINTIPEDFVSNPAYIETINDETLKSLAIKVNSKWNDLCKIDISDKYGVNSSLLNIKSSFFVPGGRFAEPYYWDSYWIIEGLLVSGMYKSAENMIDMFTDTIERYGFIPNGLRKYYLERSQPPYFCIMISTLISYTDNLVFDSKWERRLQMAIKEYNWWMKNRSVKLEGYVLNIYSVESTNPRPGSYIKDMKLTQNLDDLKRAKIWSELKSGCESGWDFSSRFLNDKNDLKSIDVSSVIPVDLNAIMFMSEAILSELCKYKNDNVMSNIFLEACQCRRDAINKILWNSNENLWNDRRFTKISDVTVTCHEFTSKGYYFSNLLPMCYGIKPPGEISIYDIMNKYKEELFGYVGGIPASSINNTSPLNLQWDFPNVWPPHAHIFSTFLVKIGEFKLGLHVARTFINNLLHFDKIYEKYDCRKNGVSGNGGEYEVQIGFGWTNGVAISFLSYFKDELCSEIKFKDEKQEIFRILESKKSGNM